MLAALSKSVKFINKFDKYEKEEEEAQKKYGLKHVLIIDGCIVFKND